MRKFFASALASTAILGLSACATGLPTKVSRFEAMPPPSGQSFFIVPMDPAEQGGLEFGRYAEMVTQELQEEGYRPAASAEEATMIVQLGYDVDEGRERVVSDPYFDRWAFERRAFYDPFYRWRYRPLYARRYYGRRLPYSYGWDDPYWYSPFGRDHIRSFTEYRSELELDIRKADTGEAIFEGSAKARSRTDELGTLVPNLITAMFTDFPGNSGETIKITVKPEKDD